MERPITSMESKRILLTGHKGLVGSAILEENIDNIVTYPCRLNSMDCLSDFIKDNHINTIIHCAAIVGGIVANANKIDFYLENSKLNNIVFEASYKNHVKQFINLSSTCVFPDNIDYPLTEEKVYLGPPHFSNDAYAISKRDMSMLCAFAFAQGLDYTTLIPCNIYGKNDNYNISESKSHVLPALVHKCYLAKLNNIDFIVGGNGNPLREFLYADDLARIIKQLLYSSFEVPESLIVSPAEEVSIKECAEIIADIMKFKGKIVFDPNFPNGQLRKPSSNKKLKEFLPDIVFTDFRQGLEESIEWFIDNYEIARR